MSRIQSVPFWPAFDYLIPHFISHVYRCQSSVLKYRSKTWMSLHPLVWCLVNLGDCRIVQNLLSRLCQFLCLRFLGLEQEREFFQRLSIGFWEEEIDEYHFETQPTHVDEKVFPISIFKTDRIDKAPCLDISIHLFMFQLALDVPNMTEDRPKSWNHESPFVRTVISNC